MNNIADDKAMAVLISCRDWKELMLTYRWIQNAYVISGDFKESAFSICIRLNNMKGFK